MDFQRIRTAVCGVLECASDELPKDQKQLVRGAESTKYPLADRQRQCGRILDIPSIGR